MSETDFVAELRRLNEWAERAAGHGTAMLLAQAADRIAELEAEVEQLKAALPAGYGGLLELVEKHRSRANRAEAERDRLREALRELGILLRAWQDDA